MFQIRETPGAVQAAPEGRVSDDIRLYAIGDIHGSHDLLVALLQRIAEDGATRTDWRAVRIVFLGDYVDRGDDSAGVLSVLSRLWRDQLPELVFLKGNHEAALLEFLDDPVAGRRWLAFGAVQTLASYGLGLPDRADPDTLVALRDALVTRMGDHVDFLRKGLRICARFGNVMTTHAGLAPGYSGATADEVAMVWGHPEFLVPRPVQGVRVVHGHHDHDRPVVEPGRICVDTGAYYTGRLTAVRLDDGESFLSVSVRDLP